METKITPRSPAFFFQERKEGLLREKREGVDELKGEELKKGKDKVPKKKDLLKLLANSVKEC